MTPLRRFSLITLGLFLLGSLALSTASAAEDPIIKLDSQSEMEIDLKMIVGDFLPQILEMTKTEDPMKGQMMELAVELLGVRSLDRLHMTSTTTKAGGLHRSTLTLDPEVEGGLLRTMFAVPDGTFRFGKYLREDDAAALVSLVNFSEGLTALYDMATSPEMAAMIPAPLFTEDEDGEITLFGINLKRDIFPLLAGELDLIVFAADQVGATDPPPMAIVLGTSDGPALRDRIFEIMRTQMGETHAADMAAMTGVEVGNFTFYDLPHEAAYAVSDEYIVATSAPDRLRDMLADPRGNIAEKKARQYVRMDTEYLFQLMATKVGEDAGSMEVEMMEEMLDALRGEEPGVFEVTTNCQPNRLDTEVRQPGNLLSMEYRLFREMLAMAPKMAAQQSRRGEYVAMVSVLDAAFTQYGVDHGGEFPEDVHELVEEEYLLELPELVPTPLGHYLEGGYTYLPVRESGRVVGYYFLLYGAGMNTGFDLLTPENIEDPAAFVPARDGVLDGIVSFCYDGVALEQIRKWNAKN